MIKEGIKVFVNKDGNLIQGIVAGYLVKDHSHVQVKDLDGFIRIFSVNDVYLDFEEARTAAMALLERSKESTEDSLGMIESAMVDLLKMEEE